MKISLDSLQVVESIARRGTFGLAGNELHRAPSSLSYVVQKLESDLGIRVFDRSGHRVRLTRAGTVLVEEGRQVLRSARELEDRARRTEAGWENELAIATNGLVPFDALLSFIPSFQAAISHTRLRFSHDLAGDCWQALFDNRVDLVIGAIGNPPAVHELSIVPVGDLKPVFVVSPRHPLAATMEPLACSALREHQFVEVSAKRDMRCHDQETLAWKQHIGVPDLKAKILVLKAGIACGFLPSCTAREHIGNGSLVSRTLAAERPAHPLYLAWRARDPGRALAWWIERKDALLSVLRRRLELQEQ